MQIFRFSCFRLWAFYPTGINIGSKRPHLLLKHAEKQSETRRVQSLRAKSGASEIIESVDEFVAITVFEYMIKCYCFFGSVQLFNFSLDFVGLAGFQMFAVKKTGFCTVF